MLLKWKPWVSFLAEGGRLMSWGMWLLPFSSWLNYLSCSSCALGLRTQAWWDSDLARGLCFFTETVYFELECVLLRGRFAGNKGVRELSSEGLFKNKGNK